MKYAIIHWDLNDIGGIHTWCMNFLHAAKNDLRLDIEVVLVGYTETKRDINPTRETHKRRYSYPPCRYLSMHPKHIERTLDELRKYDRHIFLHPSPHPTKAVLGRDGVMNWLRIWQLPVKSMVIFHDAKWEKTNDWIAGHASNFDFVVPAQRHFRPSVERWIAQTNDVEIVDSWFPQIVVPWGDVTPIRDRDLVASIHTQWLKWKNHHLLVHRVDEITSVRLDIYGSGMEYHNLHAEGSLSKFAEDRASALSIRRANAQTSHRLMGYVPYDQSIAAMRRSRACIDLSSRGYINMSHLEPMGLGTPSVMAEEAFLDPHASLPRECVRTFSDIDELIELLNQLTHDTTTTVMDEIVRNAHEFARANLDRLPVTRRLIETLD
jgi:hypothetical protein